MTNAELEHLLLEIQEETMKSAEAPAVRLKRIRALLAVLEPEDGETQRKSKR